MAINWKKFLLGINVVPKSGSTADSQGDIEVDSATTKLNFHNGTTASPMVTETHASQGSNRLTNKDLEDSSTKIVDASDTSIKIAFNAAGTTSTTTTITSSQTTNKTITLPDATDTLVGKATTDSFTNKTYDAEGSGNSLSNIKDSNIKAAAAIARSKIAAGTADHVVINATSTGLLSSEATLAKSRGGTAADNSSVTFPASGTVQATTPNNHGVIVSGSAALATVIAPDASTTKVLVSGGASADPAWGTVAIAAGGTGQVTKAAGFDALSPMTTGGDLIYGGASGTATRLANGTSGQFLKSNGTTTAPSWTSATSTLIGFRVQKTPTSSAFDGTVALIFGSNVLYDTASGYNTGTGVYTIPTTGYWEISAQCGVSATWGLNAGMFLILKKGSTTQSYSTEEAAAAATFNLNCPHSTTIALTSGDTISYRVQTAGTAVGPAISSDDNSSWFEAKLVGV